MLFTPSDHLNEFKNNWALTGETPVAGSKKKYAITCGPLANGKIGFAKIFGTPGFLAHVLGDARMHTIAASRCY